MATAHCDWLSSTRQTTAMAIHCLSVIYRQKGLLNVSSQHALVLSRANISKNLYPTRKVLAQKQFTSLVNNQENMDSSLKENLYWSS